MTTDPIRKQVYELTPSDRQLYAIWEFALDEEGVEGQDEATVRPAIGRAFAWSGDVARATFTTSDGARFIGYVTPDILRTPWLSQPTIVTENGQVNLWFGWQEAGVSEEMIRPLYQTLGKNAGALFPVRYALDVPWNDRSGLNSLEGEITGFGWLPALGGEEIRERR